MTVNGSDRDEFYVNYGKIPPGFTRHLLWFVPLVVAIAIALGLILPQVHTQFNDGRSFSLANEELIGILQTQPAAQLLVPRSGDTSASANYSRYLMMAFNKASLSADFLEENEGQWLNVKGTLFNRNTLAGIATSPTRSEPTEAPENPPPIDRDVSLGEFSLVGEIVDSKCYPGVMKPGRTHTHRACAIRCISGGIPPVFVVESGNSEKLYFLLADREGKAVNDRVLDKVADPLLIKGEVIQRGDMFLLQADPETYELI
ncbi:MAG: hypothetical protein J7647_32585 [Cyanobacteria bacterium SBLK]|nr:hypothetical protein [Cyanobacteria bacterium SBLK]